MLKDRNIDLVEVLFWSSDSGVAVLPARIAVSRFAANRFPSRTNRHAVAAQINRPLAFWTKRLMTWSPGQRGSRRALMPDKSEIVFQKNPDISWSIIDGEMLWSTKSWCSAPVFGEAMSNRKFRSAR